MMNIKISGSVGKTYSNNASCSELVQYLEKENENKQIPEHEMFFSHDNDKVRYYEVIEAIDKAGKKQLTKEDAKFYHIAISPSEAEQEHFKHNPEALKEYTRQCMDKYAENFGKGLKGSDLIYFAKVENERHYKSTDEAVKAGEKKIGERKEGNNMHVHIIVSRKTADHKKKISPLTNHKNTEKGTVKGGFNRTEFYKQCESQFDKQFNYKRSREETFEYCNTMVHGTVKERVNEVVKVEQEKQQQKAEELKTKQEAEQQKAADLKATQEAEQRTAAELKAKQEAEQQKAADLKATQEAEQLKKWQQIEPAGKKLDIDYSKPESKKVDSIMIVASKEDAKAYFKLSENDENFKNKNIAVISLNGGTYNKEKEEYLQKFIQLNPDAIKVIALRPTDSKAVESLKKMQGLENAKEGKGTFESQLKAKELQENKQNKVQHTNKKNITPDL
jgi:hypothetical protein